MGILLLLTALAQAIEVHGHRGARALYPENTLPAFSYAIEAGVDFLELDVRLTKDGKIVVHHDPELSTERCLDSQGKPAAKGLKLREMRLAEIQSYDCGSIANARFPQQHVVPGTHVPELAEVFRAVRESRNPNAQRVGVHIEIKEFPGGQLPPPKEFGDRLASVIREEGFLDRVIIQSFDFRYTAAANRAVDLAGRKVDRKVISPKFEWLHGAAGRLLFRQLKARGFEVVPWTANAPEDWKYLIDLGVDGIVTDDPAALITYLKREHS